MKVVVVGRGGREHALAKKIRSSALLTQLWVCPGNAGMELDGFTCEPFESNDAIEAFCVKNQVSLVVVGPEVVILSDLKARLHRHGIFCFAPDAKVARLESSKIFCKEILEEAHLPTASALEIHTREQAFTALTNHSFENPIVIKADGLAQGKGVWVCENLENAKQAIQVMADQFGYPMLFEQCLVGPELSAFAVCDGLDFVVIGTACDYKRITADPFSPNTGGMGAYSPCDFLTQADHQAIHDIFKQTLQCLHKRSLSYQGFLFAGLMKTSQGIYVLEFNVRMGDPETQALLPRLQTDLLSLIHAAVTHNLKDQACVQADQCAVHVVATSEGYPSVNLKTGYAITAPAVKDIKSDLYYAGVKKEKSQILNAGGRVLGVTALAASKQEARVQAYQDLSKISFEGMYFRKDIGQ